MYNPYEVLGVSALDSKDTIRARYRSLCKKYHPDVSETGDSKKFMEIYEAWQYINSHTEEGKGTEFWSHKTLFTVERKNL